ncbi:MAG: hypothetical protein DHS20C18_08440 [Saprospiraceae bacterium]|nr:MAG: hypothetical protein DHS20C18_08440 [Saprospiraceae bacterium]
MDFTNIITTDFQITYDPTLLEFQNAVDAGNLPNFSPTDITVVTPGVLQVEWGVIPDCADDPANIGVTLADALTVYQLCFKVIGSYGSVADISIGNPPTPRITRTGSNCSNIGLLTNTGQITACVRQVEVYATEETGNTGDLVCVDFRVNGWDAMLGAQFTINWDPDVIVGEQMIVGDIPNTNTSTVVIFGNGTATVSWSYFVPGEPGITVPDSTLFFQICYRIVGDCEDFSSITFSGSPTPIEFTNDNEEFEGFNLPVLLTPGSVTVNDCDPIGLQLFADCGDVVSLNDEFCVTVSVGDNFQQISDFAYLMQWNPNILEFTSVTNVNAALNQFDFPGDFNVSNESNGILGVDWSATPGVGSQSLPAGTVLYDVCFKVIGLGGNSPFSFTNPSNVQINNGPNIGINPSNCEVQVNQPDGVAMLIGSGQSPPGEEFCVDITVANFADIIDYQFSLSWNNTLFDLTQVTNINIPGASFPGNFIDASDFGALAFDWESVSPVTLPDGGVIMTLCFNPLSDPGDCDMLEMVDIPLVAQAINTGSNGENIGIIQIDGELCTLFPEGFGITIADGQIGWLDTICLPVSVSSFDNITGAEFCISWDPVNLQFLEVNNLNTWPGLTSAEITASPAGTICIDWEDAAGAAIPDDTDVFELCFVATGQADTCYNISVIDSPLPVVTTTDGMGSMVYTDGELCVDDRLVIIGSTIDSIGCDGICDATAAVEVVGGSGEYRYYWKAEPIDQFTPVAENLCEGQVIVTVYDENDLDLSVTDTFFIVASGNVPGAMVNSDTVSIGCDPALALLSGTASGISGQPGESQQWYRLTGNVPLTPAGAASVFATLPGRYYFEVRNADGCVARDTALVVQSGGPIADAGEGFTLDCFSDVFQLDGTGSAQGDNVTYHWTGPAGLFLEDTASIIPRINGPGTYTLEVTDNISSCTSTSQVTIGAAPAAPESTATPFELELGCDGSSVTFDGAGSFNPGRNVSFEWYDLEETTLLSSDTTLSVNQLGCYVLIVRDIDSNCAARDTVCVVPNAGAPIVAAGEDQTLNCNVDTVTIMATVGPDTIDFTFDWMAIDGGPLVPGTETSLTPQATNPGTYVITAVNTANNCEATDTIVVVLDTIAPMIDAGPPVILNCSMPLDTLFGVISSGETDVTIIWTGPAGDTLGNELMLIIQDEGTYCMEVINNATGCSAIDCTEATIDGIPPMIIIENFELDLTCTNDTLTLTPDDITPPNPAYEISWETEGPDAAILTTSADGLTITVATPGIYRIVVTDPANGCAGENEFIIDVNNAIPVSDAGENASITCTDATAEIGGTTSTIGDDIIYLWTNTIDGEAPNPNNTMTITVGTAGTYELLVRDTITGCEATSQVEVTPDFEVANIVFSDPAMLTCADSCADLTATIDNISDFSVSWSSLNGGSPDPADQLITSVCEAGGFVLTVTNNANGCVVSDTVFVTENMDPPAIVIATPLEFGCEDTSVTLDASGTGVVGDFSLIEWSGPGTITPATGSLVVEVSTPGDYDLHVVRADNGCEDTQTVSVVPDPDFPEADAGVDFDMECGETSVLDGTASSAGDYQWTVISGTPLTGDVTSLTPEVTGAGVYELIVSNATNGCEDRDTVEVSLNLPADVAVVGADINTCQDSVEITATPVSGTVSGMWINLSLADLADPSAATTTASNLPTGNSLFVWSLSAPGCENYDSDTLIVSRANNPAVANDLLQISAEEREGVINIIANDGLGVTSGFTITLLNDPEIGTVDSLVNGVLYFSVGQGIFGEANITYEVCIDACPDLCGTANITIQIADDGFEPELPNTITPNGDGINDALVFDALLGKPAEDVPDNELIVFNRWGDIVYEARPYNNDWKGVNESGDDLPQGTYYYILRLKIGSGEIIRGDITIVK